MKKLIKISLWYLGIDNYKLQKDIEYYLYDCGIMYFNYNDEADYGDVLYLIHKFIKDYLRNGGKK